jgi:excinuclease UvrABC helicase subunit UvrB
LLQDLRRGGGIEPRLSKKEKADLEAEEGAQNRRQTDEMLRSAGMDPRPPRRDGCAVRRSKAEAIVELRNQLKQAVLVEDYESAAALRDQLRELEQ